MLNFTLGKDCYAHKLKISEVLYQIMLRSENDSKKAVITFLLIFYDCLALLLK